MKYARVLNLFSLLGGRGIALILTDFLMNDAQNSEIYDCYYFKVPPFVAETLYNYSDFTLRTYKLVTK